MAWYSMEYLLFVSKDGIELFHGRIKQNNYLILSPAGKSSLKVDHIFGMLNYTPGMPAALKVFQSELQKIVHFITSSNQ
jgi:hypothetical protein